MFMYFGLVICFCFDWKLSKKKQNSYLLAGVILYQVEELNEEMQKIPTIVYFLNKLHYEARTFGGIAGCL